MGAERKKQFHELSTIAQLHTATKRFGENAEFPFIKDAIQEIKIYRTLIEDSILNPSESKEELSTHEGDHMKKVIQDVLSVKLREEAKDDPEERKRLELCRKKIKEYLGNVLSSTKEYMSTIIILTEASKTNSKTAIANADDQRGRKHNALMSDINILNRSMLWWFGKFNPNNLSDRQLQMYEKQEDIYISHDIERIDIPANGICTNETNATDLKEITKWAKEIYKDLISIQNLSGI